MSVLTALMVKIGADSSGLRKELKTAKRDIDRTFSRDPVSGFEEALTGTASKVSSLITKFNTAVVLAGGGFGLTALISSAVTAGDSIKDLSEKLRISTAEAEMFSRTVKLAGGDVDTASGAMMRLDSTITGSGEKAEKTRAILDSLGVSLTDHNGKLLPLNEQLKNLAQGYQAASDAGYGQEFIMNTLGVRGMALTETLMKYNEAAEDAAKIKGIGLDPEQMSDINRQLKITEAQLEQLTMAGGALLAPIVGEYLPAITQGLADTAGLIAGNKEEIVSLGTSLAQLAVTYKVLQAIAKAGGLTGSAATAAAEVEALSKAQEAAITRRLNMLKAAQKKEEQLMAKEVAARKITEAEKEKAITESCMKIQMKYAETSARIEAEMRAAYRKMNAEAKMSAAGQVQAIATTGAAAKAAGAQMVTASAAAKGAVGSLTKSVWALVGGWYAVAAAIAFAFEKLVAFKQQQAQEQGLTGGDIYSIDGQQYRRADDGKFYRRDINMDAEDAFDTYTETQVLEDDEISMLQAAYERKHPATPKPETKQAGTDKFKDMFANAGSSGGGGGGSKGSSGKAEDPEKEELKRRQKLQNSLEHEFSMRKTINEAMRESNSLQMAYMTSAEKAVYGMQKEHEKAVEEIRKRWFQFETEYIGMSDEERARFVKNLEETGAAYEITADGRLSLAKQTAMDIAAAEKQYEDEIVQYHTQCKDILAEIDDAFKANSIERLQEALSEENTAVLNAYNTRQGIMKRYYDNWLQAHKSTKELMADIVLDTQSGFESFFKNVLTGQKSFGDAFMDLLNSLLDSIVKSIAETMAAQVVNQFLSWILPMGGGNMVNTPIGGHNVAFPRVPGKAEGGFITGPGTATSDSIPAMLSDGEYVINADAVRKIGIPTLNAINTGAVSRFAQGGYVSPGTAGGTAVGGIPNVIVNLYNESGMQMDAQQTETNFDGENYIVSVVMNAFATNKMGIRTTMKGAMS